MDAPKKQFKCMQKHYFRPNTTFKTRHGISTEYYSNDTTPVYGNGQGAGDSPSQWSQESALLFRLYQSKMPGAALCDRERKQTTMIPLAAFADDTNLLGNNNNDDKSQGILKRNGAFYGITKMLLLPPVLAISR
jgi:hypothetical protein